MMRADCMLTGRCPTCTMILPCQHFEDIESIVDRGWFPQKQWDSLPQTTQTVMIDLKKELSGGFKAIGLVDNKRDLSRLHGMNQALQAKENFGQFEYIRQLFCEQLRV